MCVCGWVGVGGARIGLVVGREKGDGTCGALWRAGALCLVLGTGLGAPGPLGHQLRDSRLYSIKGEDGRRPLPLGAFTCDRCSGEIRWRRRKAAEACGWVPKMGREGRTAVPCCVPAG